MTLRDEVLDRINRWHAERAAASYRLHIPKAIDDQLERMDAVTLANVERLLEVVAQVAAEASEHDPVWADLEGPEPGVFKADGPGFSVFFEVDHRGGVVMVSRFAEAR